MICNAAHYASWPVDVRAAVDACADIATEYQHKLAAAEDAAIRAKLDMHENEILELSPAEHAAFVAAMQPVLARYRDQLDARLFELLSAA